MQDIQRKALKQQRKALSRGTQQRTEHRICMRIIRSAIFKKSQHIGLYLHAFGEVHTHLLIMQCFKHQKTVYLPQISSSKKHLVWVKITQNQYIQNRFSRHALGMYEPKQRGKLIHILDLVVTPLLACDALGTRIGMGGGFYDRTLCFAPYLPYRLGIAHAFQYIASPIPRQKWDQPIDALYTVNKTYCF
ncbi:5-formyltetrahydrofolate cyclo-ligase [Acinetobacter sp. B5B]|uniref:5-formyltetrahydrofolate cyclo-ligase n=1 Tax=Acinetobacter baretiae TaxID=2605383 RepID=UPI0018C334B0|nr:5-formyltetrahydrofolate cyclo-ligase [Acinetobacter baretiae]MBF7682770.1 5-formyltetrahydrofolate cyclo-ligase [Acinetobacter baretiae]MBF7685002.1 5-formyltetrahydrofolate cyclo-ligase [Acinetobacter baretiae]